MNKIVLPEEIKTYLSLNDFQILVDGPLGIDIVKSIEEKTTVEVSEDDPHKVTKGCLERVEYEENQDRTVSTYTFVFSEGPSIKLENKKIESAFTYYPNAAKYFLEDLRGRNNSVTFYHCKM